MSGNKTTEFRKFGTYNASLASKKSKINSLSRKWTGSYAQIQWFSPLCLHSTVFPRACQEFARKVDASGMMLIYRIRKFVMF